jgi:hypothetical protein
VPALLVPCSFGACSFGACVALHCIIHAARPPCVGVVSIRVVAVAGQHEIEFASFSELESESLPLDSTLPMFDHNNHTSHLHDHHRHHHDYDGFGSCQTQLSPPTSMGGGGDDSSGLSRRRPDSCPDLRAGFNGLRASTPHYQSGAPHAHLVRHAPEQQSPPLLLFAGEATRGSRNVVPRSLNPGPPQMVRSRSAMPMLTPAVIPEVSTEYFAAKPTVVGWGRPATTDGAVTPQLMSTASSPCLSFGAVAAAIPPACSPMSPMPSVLPPVPMSPPSHTPSLTMRPRHQSPPPLVSASMVGHVHGSSEGIKIAAPQVVRPAATPAQKLQAAGPLPLRPSVAHHAQSRFSATFAPELLGASDGVSRHGRGGLIDLAW